MLKHEAYDMCKAHMNRFVRLQMQDGAVYDGVIENVDDEHVYVASPVREGPEGEDARYFPYGGYGYGYPGYGYPGYPFYPGFPYGYPRFRRFALPLAALLALSLLPYGYGYI